MTTIVVLEPHANDLMKVKTHLSICSMMAFSMKAGLKLKQVAHMGSTISFARNELVKGALEQDWDFALFIDSDMTFPPDSLVRLVSRDKDIVSPLCVKRTPPYEVVGVLKDPTQTSGLAEAFFIPGAFFLTKRKIFERMFFPWFYESWVDEKLKSEDQNFIYDAQRAGFEVWADLDLSYEMGHIGEITASLRR